MKTVDRGLDRALSHHAPVDRNFRGDAALHWRHLQSLRMDPCRHHPGTRTVRPAQEIRQAEKNHLAAAPAQRLETDAQPLTPTTGSTTNPVPCTRRNGENRYPTTRHPPRTEHLPLGRLLTCQYHLLSLNRLVNEMSLMQLRWTLNLGTPCCCCSGELYASGVLVCLWLSLKLASLPGALPL